MRNDLLTLLRPRLLSVFKSLKPSKTGKSWAKVFIFSFIGLLFWSGSFFIFFRVLTYFQSVEDFGNILALKLLSMMMIIFFALLIFSSIINSLSQLYLSHDLPLLHSLPVSSKDIYLSRWFSGTLDSSWMVVAFSLPVFLSYGMIYSVGIGFYLVAFAAIIILCLIASSLSSAVVMAGTIILPAGKIRTLFVILGVALAILLVVVLRMIRPEQLVNPETFASVVIYMNSLQALDEPWLPTTWLTDAVGSALNGKWKHSFFNLALAASLSFTLIYINQILAGAFYFRGFSRAQTTAKRLFQPLNFRGRSWEGLLSFLSRPARAFAVKEIRTFFRDSTQWPQLFLISALIIIYLYNFSVLPLDKSPVGTIYMQNVFSFLNMGLAAFVLSAIAARFVYPAVSIEGEAFWIIKAAPVSVKTFLWIKFFIYYIPLLILSEILIVASNILLGVTPFIMVLSIVTIFFLVPSIVALALGMGAIYPDFKSENPAMAVTSFGGLLFMLLSFGLIALVIILEARPVYQLFMADLHGRNLSVIQIYHTIFSFSAAFLLCAASVYIPLRLAEKKLRRL
ncbi:MAG TPA: hypothetical protein ENN23_10210 [Deltaproteobacteria bacterium]|nr:hypothetical protein [Deltaproteobacteria bacterium]